MEPYYWVAIYFLYKISKVRLGGYCLAHIYREDWKRASTLEDANYVMILGTRHPNTAHLESPPIVPHCIIFYDFICEYAWKLQPYKCGDAYSDPFQTYFMLFMLA